jgi:hypothetical protein
LFQPLANRWIELAVSSGCGLFVRHIWLCVPYGNGILVENLLWETIEALPREA